jgi:hypothetical protein
MCIDYNLQVANYVNICIIFFKKRNIGIISHMWTGGIQKGDRCWQTKGIQKSVLPVGIPMAHFCSWAQQSASRGHAWVSWAPPYASEMAALIVMTPAAAALVDRSVTSDIPRDHCISHALYLPVLLRWCKLLSSFTASIILLPQQLHALRDGRTTHFLVCLPYINWHWLPVWIWLPCTSTFGDGWRGFDVIPAKHVCCLASASGHCHMWISYGWRKLGTKQLGSQTLQRLFLCKFSGCKTKGSLMSLLRYWSINMWQWLPWMYKCLHSVSANLDDVSWGIPLLWWPWGKRSVWLFLTPRLTASCSLSVVTYSCCCQALSGVWGRYVFVPCRPYAVVWKSSSTLVPFASFVSPIRNLLMLFKTPNFSLGIFIPICTETKCCMDMEGDCKQGTSRALLCCLHGSLFFTRQ